MATRTIGTELVLSGEKEFNDAMKGVNSNLKNIRSDMALVTAEFDGNADSMEALTKKQKVLQDSVDQHQAKVNILQERYDHMKKKYGENSAEADKYRQQLNNATVALLKEQKALDKTTAAIEDQKKETKKHKEATEDSTKATEKAAKSHKKLEKAAESTKKALSGVGKVAGGMGKMVGGAAAAAAAATIAITAAGATALVGVANWAKEAADSAKAAYEAGEKLTDSQKQWLAFSKQLDGLDGSVANAKSSIAGILLPMLGDLTAEGGAFLDAFAKDMKASTGDTNLQTQILGRYIADGARLIIAKLPDYVNAGKEVLGGVVTGFKESAAEGELLEVGLDLIMDFLNFVVEEAPVLAEGGLKLAQQILDGIEGQDVGEAVSKFIQNLCKVVEEKAPELIPAGVRLVLELLKGIAKNYDKILEGAWDMVIAIKDGAVAALGVLKEVGPQIVDELITSLKSSDSDVLQWCGEFIESIKNGIIEGVPKLKEAIGEALEPVFEVFQNGWPDFVEGWRQFFNGKIQYNGEFVDIGTVHGSHAGGLQYVPFDGYLAELHRGEQVLTAKEAEAYRSGKGKGVTVNIYTQSLSLAEMDAIIKYADGKLGDDLP